MVYKPISFKLDIMDSQKPICCQNIQSSETPTVIYPIYNEYPMKHEYIQLGFQLMNSMDSRKKNKKENCWGIYWDTVVGLSGDFHGI